IERSSNIFFYKMGISLGIDKMYQYASALGIGHKTGIQLSNEVPGLMPNSEWKKQQYGEEWQPGENLSNAIGQGFVLTTPLQMVLAFNAIGTEGKLYKPFIVKQLTDHKNQIIKEFSSEMVKDLSQVDENGFFIDKENFKIVKEGMRRVANGEHGTARWYKIPGIEIAGKTGTAQVRSFTADQIYEKCDERPIEERHHGWFVGFAPAEYPEITVAVLAEHACHGSTGGAPVVRDVIKAYFEKYHPEKLKDKKSKT
ncbi:MAG: penicillin-binding protein 2, partial [Bdellovibrionales bacterium]|nr:penicillin-binding protein 2 [Bdellovibrionales bacterium]